MVSDSVLTALVSKNGFVLSKQNFASLSFVSSLTHQYLHSNHKSYSNKYFIKVIFVPNYDLEQWLSLYFEVNLF